MLLLTADPDAQPWADFIDVVKEVLDDDFLDSLSSNLEETTRVIRDRYGEERDVTHWTDNGYVGADTIADKMKYAFEEQGDLSGYLGYGNFSNVWECDWDYSKAIKIGTGSRGDLDIWDDGWLKYAHYCMLEHKKDKPNPLVPKVYRLYIDEGQKYFVALVERFDATWYETDEDDLDGKLRSRVLAIEDHLTHKHRSEEDNSFRYTLDYAEYSAHANHFKRDFRDVHDLHDQNFMLDFGNSRVVITDPSSSTGKDQREMQYLYRKLGLLPYDKYADEQWLLEQEVGKARLQEYKDANAFRLHPMNKVNAPLSLKDEWLNVVDLFRKAAGYVHIKHGVQVKEGPKLVRPPLKFHQQINLKHNHALALQA